MVSGLETKNDRIMSAFQGFSPERKQALDDPNQWRIGDEVIIRAVD